MIAYIDFRAVGSRIRKHRKQAGMTQEQLAEAIDMSSNFVGNIERGVSKPSATTLLRIALSLHITMKDLLDENTVIWCEEDTPCKLRSPDMFYCNTLSDWLLPNEDPRDTGVTGDAAPACPCDLAKIGFLAYDEAFPGETD